VKKVWIKNPSAVVALANAADEDMLRTWGLRGAGLTAVMARRPFGSVEDLAATEGVGRRTLQHLATVTDDA
jgi:DNA uptake protein ComE-like DNA-binding protein